MPGDGIMQAPILVVGAGIGGLTLARLLTIKKVPVIVYESKPKGKFANHGLWLGARTCQSLVAELQVPIGDLRTSTAVTAEVQESVKDAPPSSGMRVNKRRLLEYLASGVDVRWSHQVTAANSSEDGVAVQYREAKDDSKSSTSVVGVVGADGVHSAVRSAVLPDVKSKVLPYVAINGQRRTAFQKYHEEHASEDYQDTVKHNKGAHQTHLSTGLNDVKGGKAYSFFTYSRPQRQPEDALFKPDRSTSEANTIPEDFFQEIEASSFSDELNKEVIKDDKLLSWLMRSIEVEGKDLKSLPKGVTLIGDAMHATPILGGDGGEQAIQDAIELADLLAAAYSNGGTDKAMKEFQESALERWQNSVKHSVRRLEEMHSPSEKL